MVYIPVFSGIGGPQFGKVYEVTTDSDGAYLVVSAYGNTPYHSFLGATFPVIDEKTLPLYRELYEV